MNITLVDTTKKKFTQFVPLALLRLSAKHKAQGDTVELITAGQRPKRKPDVIYFSFIFLFKYMSDCQWVKGYRKQYPQARIVIGGTAPSLIENKFKRNLNGANIEIFTGRDLALEQLAPDFKITGYKHSYGFTTRGCPNSCDWCVVPRLEGKHNVLQNWQTQIDIDLPVFYGFDNNVLACGSDHFRDVLTYLSSHQIKLDFNQAMDAEIFHRNKKIQQVFTEFPRIWHVLRFAWDSDRVEESILFTIDFLHQHKIRAQSQSLLMLYDADDSPEVFFKRVQTIYNHPARWAMKPMRFKDLDTGVLLRKWGGIGDIFSEATTLIITGNITKGEYWDFLLKGTFEQFIERATLIKHYRQKHPKKVSAKDFITFAKKKLA